VDRHPPRSTSDTIELYVRTYYSLLRSSGEVRVRAFEEAHIYSESSLHEGARDDHPDVAAFAYSAARLPACMPIVRRLVAGQSIEQFSNAGFDVSHWIEVTAPGRRRPNRWNGGDTLAVFITSASDIDDLVPMVTAYQLEWNKMNELLGRSTILDAAKHDQPIDIALAGQALELSDGDIRTLARALAPDVQGGLKAIAMGRLDLSFRLLAGRLLDDSVTSSTNKTDNANLYNEPDFEAIASVSYQTGPVGVMLLQRYIPETVRSVTWLEWYPGITLPAPGAITVSDNTVESQLTTDLTLSYDRSMVDADARWRVSLAITNLFDVDPPVIADFGQRFSSQGLPATGYDVYGRRFLLGFNYRF